MYITDFNMNNIDKTIGNNTTADSEIVTIFWFLLVQ